MKNASIYKKNYLEILKPGTQSVCFSNNVEENGEVDDELEGDGQQSVGIEDVRHGTLTRQGLQGLKLEGDKKERKPNRLP